MTAPAPYLQLPGTAREALDFYADVFGGEAQAWTAGEMNRSDVPADLVQHGMLTGPVTLFASDADPGQPALEVTGLMLSLLGAADAATLTRWFDALSVGAREVDPLAERPWGAHDGQVVDRYGVRWLVGWEGDDSA